MVEEDWEELPELGLVGLVGTVVGVVGLTVVGYGDVEPLGVNSEA